MNRFELVLARLYATASAYDHEADRWAAIATAVGQDCRRWLAEMPEILSWPVPGMVGTAGDAVIEAVCHRVYDRLYAKEAA